jgi:hypothetical protein
MTKNIFAILLFIFAGITVSAQEMLTMPAFNPTVAKQHLVKKANTALTETITLPFYDDFSVNSVYPLQTRWADRYTFVNTDFAKYPPSVGVVTLDALDENGALYPGAGPYQFQADYLTSQPIRLDSIFSPVKRAIDLSDSIYFSFYYQPQGRSVSPPSSNDSLVLEFHSPGDSIDEATSSGTIKVPRWIERWSTNGGKSVDDLATSNKLYFKQVLIPMTGILDSTLFYKNGFQFRFRNLATLSGNSQPDWRSNGSIWNIDVVYLNVGRKIHDTIMEDVAFADLAPSMLINYEAMPYRQYAKNFDNEMRDTLSITIANLDNKNRNRTYKYNISKNSLAPFAFYDGEPYTVSPYSSDGYVTYRPWARPPVNVFYPISNEESVLFHVVHTLSPDPNSLFRSNDTIRFEQVFSNYYAYDNGSSEAGIGINGSAGSYAVQFKLNETDTLRGMQIYFNPVIGGSNQKFIDLQVWNDSNGKPGQIIKTLGGITPVYTGSHNEFNSYWFETPLEIEPGTFPGLRFYIGWTQSTLENLNVGFDRYKDSHTKRFYNVDGTWQMSDSANYGSLMMRPIVGLANPVGIEKPTAIEHLEIHPNPVSDGKLIIQLPESWKNTSQDLDYSILSSTGSRVISGVFTNPIDVSELSSGFYLVIFTNRENGQRATGKLIIR